MPFTSLGVRLGLPIRIGALFLIDLAIFGAHPRPGFHGSGVAVMAGVVVATTTQLALQVGPRGRTATALCAVSALASGLATGADPDSATVGLLALSGIDAGANLPTVESGGVAAAGTATTLLALLITDQHLAYLAVALLGVLTWSVGVSRRQSRMRADEAELRLADRERAAGEQERSARLAERANVAREIHDVLAHSLGALVLQLDALDAVVHTGVADPERLDLILQRARRLAREGLHEARQAVGTLRNDNPPLPEWIRSMVDTAGIGTLQVTGVPRPVAGDVAVTLYRTAQESLTNVVKHAPGAGVVVELAYLPGGIDLTVTDDGVAQGDLTSALSDTGGGYGLGGLRERADLIGATLTAGPRDRGWQVALHVPDDPGARAAPERSSGEDRMGA